MIAAYRARIGSKPGALCHDPWARALAGDEGEALAAGCDATFPHMELWVAVRTAYMDAALQHWTSSPHGFTQVVLLGAGLDTRAARLSKAGLRFFEVDHPLSQADKRRRLAALPDY